MSLIIHSIKITVNKVVFKYDLRFTAVIEMPWKNRSIIYYICMAVNKINKSGRKTKKRPGVVAKTKSSNHKRAKYYQKKYRGQGKTR